MPIDPSDLPILIIGQGLAGTTLALTCEQRGLPFRIVDSGENHCSHVAGGIMHPMVFRKLTYSWGVESRFLFAKSFYERANEVLGSTVFHPLNFIRIHGTDEESKTWREYESGQINGFGIGRELTQDEIPEGFILDHGASFVQNAFRLNVKDYCLLPQSKWREEGLLWTTKVTLDDLKFGEDRVRYLEEEYRCVVFAVGSGIQDLHLQTKLPVGATKGEVLKMNFSPAIPAYTLVNGGFFCVGNDDGTATVGSNFKWNNTDPSPDEEGKNEILRKLLKKFEGKTELKEHWSGIRPTSPDRRPIIGSTPESNLMFHLNGLGSKGVSHAPSAANDLLALILNNAPLPAEVDVMRFKAIRSMG